MGWCAASKSIYNPRECFKGAVVENHFRSVLRSFLDPKPKQVGRFLILLSGGPSSMSLAFMASETINNKTQSKRKMFVEAEMLYLDESVFYPWDLEFEKKNNEKLEEFAKLTGLKLNIISLAEKFKLSVQEAKDLMEANSDRGSCKEDTVVIFRNNAIQDFALKNNFSKVVVGDSALRVSFSNYFSGCIKYFNSHD